jgi:hypothetical protein
LKAPDIEKLTSLCLSRGLDWDNFVQFVSRKGIAAITYQTLKSSGYPDAPKLETLKISYLTTLTRNTYYLQELIRVLKAFEEHKIDVISLKGMFLSQRLYADITSRDESSDFDLLVKVEDREKARTVLEAGGYNFHQPERVKEWQVHDIFNKPQAKTIELHWDITPMCRSRARIQGLWQGAELVDWEGVKYYDFQPEELLLYLSAHLVHSDSFRSLRAICDIQRVIEKYSHEIDWLRLLDKAQKCGLRGSLYTALKLNRDFFSARFPADLCRRLKISLPKRFFISVFANKRVVLRGGLRRNILDKLLGYIFLELVEADTLRDYVIIFRRAFFPPKEVLGGRSYASRIFRALASLTKK